MIRTVDDIEKLIRNELGFKYLFPGFTDIETNQPHVIKCILEYEVNGNGCRENSDKEIIIKVVQKNHVKEDIILPNICEHQDPTRTTNTSLEDYLNEALYLPSCSNMLQKPIQCDQISQSGEEKMNICAYLSRLYEDTISGTEIDDIIYHEERASSCSNIIPILGAYEGKDAYYFIYNNQSYTLQDVLKYNRHVLQPLDSSNEQMSCPLDLKKRFLIYQLIQAVHFSHSKGVGFGQIRPESIQLNECLWLRLDCLPLPPSIVPPTVENISNKSITERWCLSEVSNFEYLMRLNFAAGRKMMDSVFHPILPWIIDFSSPDGDWRDLTKTKFRINKGDSMLDKTYRNSSIPHHITESLSEITYFIYMARRTPKNVLKRIVRSNFQAQEYPSSIYRMYEWTPDECIPEFYTDASVFKSLHDDLNDLSIPAWVSTPHEFIQYHRQCLESEQVSQYLHHWIDLNFGVSLAGQKAIESKNVTLHMEHLKHSHQLYKSPGFIQLFTTNHPSRCINKNEIDEKHEILPLQELEDKMSRREKIEIQYQENVKQAYLNIANGSYSSPLPPPPTLSSSSSSSSIKSSSSVTTSEMKNNSIPTTKHIKQTHFSSTSSNLLDKERKSSTSSNTTGVSTTTTFLPWLNRPKAHDDFNIKLNSFTPNDVQLLKQNPFPSSSSDLSMKHLEDMQTYEYLSLFAHQVESLLSPCYGPYMNQERENVYTLDAFAVGCIIFELYEFYPLFSSSSLSRYFHLYQQNPSSFHVLKALPQLKHLPMYIQDMVIHLIHPDVKERYCMEEILYSYTRNDKLKNVVSFPSHFHFLYQFLLNYMELSTWYKRFQYTQQHLHCINQLPEHIFQLLFPYLMELFQSSSSSTSLKDSSLSTSSTSLSSSSLSSIQRICCLNIFMEFFGEKIQFSLIGNDFFESIVSFYESINDDEHLKISLLSLSFFNNIIEYRGRFFFLQKMIPILLDWLNQISSNHIIRSLCCHVLSQMASKNRLGKSITSRYLLSQLFYWMEKEKNPLCIPSSDFYLCMNYQHLQQIQFYIPETMARIGKYVGEELTCVLILPYLFKRLPQLIDQINLFHLNSTPYDDVMMEILNILHLTHCVVNFLSASTIQREFVYRHKDSIHHLLEKLKFPSIPLKEEYDEKEIIIAPVHVGLFRIVLLTCQKVGLEATLNHVCPSFQIFFHNFIQMYSPSIHTLNRNTPIYYFIIDIIREIYLPIEEYVGSEFMFQYLPISVNVFFQDFLACKENVKSKRHEYYHHIPYKPIYIENYLFPNISSLHYIQPPELQQQFYNLMIQSIKSYSCEDFSSSSSSSSPLSSENHLNNNHRIREEDEKNNNINGLVIENDESDAIQKTNRHNNYPSKDVDWILGHVSMHSQFKPKVNGPGFSSIGNSWPMKMEVCHSIKMHTSAIHALSVDVNESILITGSKNGSICTWNISDDEKNSSFQTIHSNRESIFSIQCLTKSSSSSPYAMSCSSSTLNVFDYHIGKIMMQYKVQDAEFTCNEKVYGQYFNCLMNERHSNIYHGRIMASTDSLIYLWDIREKTKPTTMFSIRYHQHSSSSLSYEIAHRNDDNIVALASLSYGNCIAIGSSNGSIRLLDQKTGQIRYRWQAHEVSIRKLITYGNHHIISIGMDRSAFLWKIPVHSTLSTRIKPLSSFEEFPECHENSTILLHRYEDQDVLFAVANNKMSAYPLKIPVNQPQMVDSIPQPIHGKSIMITEPPKTSKSKLHVHSMQILPMHKLLLLGTDEGKIKVCL